MASQLQTSAPPDPGPGTSFRVATTIVITIGLLEVIVAIWGLANKRRQPDPAPHSAATAAEAASYGRINHPPPFQPLPPPPSWENAPMAPSGQPGPPGPIPFPDAPPTATPAPATGSAGDLLLPEAQQIRDPIILEAIADGIRLREEGDAQGALTRFRGAADLLGDHPVVLSELGRTYEIMDLQEKAIDCWERIYRMGEAGAGDYYVIADVRLRGLDPGTGAESGSRLLKFDRISQEKGKTGSPEAGETILLRIPIARSGEGQIVASEVSVYVYFYDRVNGDRIEQSTADPPQSSWRTLPVNWESVDPEIFEIVYHHPTLSPREIRELGRRTYFGYVLKLYYQDRLQDIVAEPRLLLDYAPATTLPQINDILFR